MAAASTSQIITFAGHTWDLSTIEGRRAFVKYHNEMKWSDELERLLEKLYPLAMGYARKEADAGAIVPPFNWEVDYCKETPMEDKGYKPYPRNIVNWDNEDAWLSLAVNGEDLYQVRVTVHYRENDWVCSKALYWLDYDAAAYLYYRLMHLAFEAAEKRYEKNRKKADFKAIRKALIEDADNAWSLV